LLTVARPAKPFAPMRSASTATRPAFVTIAIRPLSLGRVAATHTSFPKFGKGEYFLAVGLTDQLGVSPVGQHKGMGPFSQVACGAIPASGMRNK